MRSCMTPEQFIKKWAASVLSEKSAAQQHFLDLCALLGEPPPAEADPTGETFTFEKGGTTATGGHGWADVWRKGIFAWEYKGPGKDLSAAYVQLKKYADMLENPPLLITSDMKRIEIHTNFTNTVKAVHTVDLAELIDPAKRELVRAAFNNPEKLRPGITRQQVTKEAAENFSALAHHLQGKGFEPQRVAHFLNRVIFSMFAEDVGLLPNRIFTKLVKASVTHPEAFESNAQQLFSGMAHGGAVAFEVIDWFNGGLFDDDATLPLDKTELQLVLKCAELDWSNIEPSIFGTLFERGLDPDKRSQQGAHYTDPETIMKIVRPVVIEPWERAWEVEKTALTKLVDRAKKTVSEAAKQRFYLFLERLATFRVLDPACGSGNFLYLALRGLKDFEKRVIHDGEAMGLPLQFPRVGPEAVRGIEVNPYAAELARVTIWIGELQWMIENGFGASKNPILKPLDQIECRDAILNEDGTEPEWPDVDVIVGNPPFLGDRKMRGGLGTEYSDLLRQRFKGRVPRGADLCCYWFEKARDALMRNRVSVVGLVATNSIRGGKNRVVLDQILINGQIFRAWSDEEWVNEGASVHVSLICFAGSGYANAQLDGAAVQVIYSDLSAAVGAEPGVDVTRARALAENDGVCLHGSKKIGSFDIDGPTARAWLVAGGNPNGRPNADVLRPVWNGKDIAGRNQDRWIIDFGIEMSEVEASLYELPFAHVRDNVRLERSTNNNPDLVRKWWIHGGPRPAMRLAMPKYERLIATPEVSKHRFFVFVPTNVLPDAQLKVVLRDDDTTFGILSSKLHEVWALRLGTSLEDRPRYTPTTTFATFPFPSALTPNVPAKEYEADVRSRRIAASANRLNALREAWLNPPDLVNRVPEVVSGYPDRILPKSEMAAKELKKRTLTNLYNTSPLWLRHAHQEVDEAVASAYGWKWPLTDGEILEKLFELNQARAVDL